MFSNKSIRILIQKDSGVFMPGVPTLEFKGLPVDVHIRGVGGLAGIEGVVRIYGVSKSHMDMITTMYWKTMTPEQKAIRVYVNDGDSEHLLYEGGIISAMPNYDNAPDVFIEIKSMGGYFFNIKNVEPYSFKGNINQEQVCKDICNQYGINCEIYGVLSVCTNPYFNQSGLTNRINAVCRQYGLKCVVENSCVRIYPKDTKLVDNWVIKSNEYIGYPSFTDVGVKIKLDRLYYDMRILDTFTIRDSEVSAANDKWDVVNYEYNLSTKIGGKWEMVICGIRSGE